MPSSIDACPKCGVTGGMSRLPRSGFLQKRILPLLGLYPWECLYCRRLSYFRKRYKRRSLEVKDELGPTMAPLAPKGSNPRP